MLERPFLILLRQRFHSADGCVEPLAEVRHEPPPFDAPITSYSYMVVTTPRRQVERLPELKKDAAAASRPLLTMLRLGTLIRPHVLRCCLKAFFRRVGLHNERIVGVAGEGELIER